MTRNDWSHQYYLVHGDDYYEICSKLFRSLVYKGYFKLEYLQDYNKNEYILTKPLND